MALYIVTEDSKEYLWNVGQKLPAIGNSPIKEVQADGHELEHIITNFVNIPYNKSKRVVRWEGDLAKLIATNL